MDRPARAKRVAGTDPKLRIARCALQAAFLISPDLGASVAERLFTSPRRYPRPAREQTALATARRFDIDVALGAPHWHGRVASIAAWRWGSGPAVLLVHGWEGRGAQLGELVEPLVAAGLSVVAFDAPAHGESAGARLYLTDLADCIAAVARAAGPLHAVIAHSFGAAGTLLAHARGELDAPRIAMIAPSVLISDALAQFARIVAMDDADRRLFERSLAASSGVPLADVEVDALVGRATTDDHEQLASVPAEMLIIHDRGDREVPIASGERLAAAWPRAELVVTDGLGHRRILRDRAVIARVVDHVRTGARPPASDLVREVDRCLAAEDGGIG